jgi:hypothetical protein
MKCVAPAVHTKGSDDFKTMKAQGIVEEEAMRALLECPKLISRKDLGKQIKEI